MIAIQTAAKKQRSKFYLRNTGKFLELESMDDRNFSGTKKTKEKCIALEKSLLDTEDVEQEYLARLSTIRR